MIHTQTFPVNLSNKFLRRLSKYVQIGDNIVEYLAEVPLNLSDEKIIQFLRPPFAPPTPLTETDIAVLVVIDDIIANSHRVANLFNYVKHEPAIRDKKMVYQEIEETVLDQLFNMTPKQLAKFVQKHKIPDSYFMSLYTDEVSDHDIKQTAANLIKNFPEVRWYDLYLELLFMKDDKTYRELFEASIETLFSDSSWLKRVKDFERKYPNTFDMIVHKSMDLAYFLIYHSEGELARELGVSPEAVANFSKTSRRENKNTQIYVQKG